MYHSNCGPLFMSSDLDIVRVGSAGEERVDVLVLPVEGQELTHDVVSTTLVVLAACVEDKSL